MEFWFDVASLAALGVFVGACAGYAAIWFFGGD